MTILAALMIPPRLLNDVSMTKSCETGDDCGANVDMKLDDADEKLEQDSDTISTKSSFVTRFRPLIHWRMILLLSKSFIRGWSSGVYYVLVPYFVQQYGFSATRVTYLYMVGGGMNISIRILLIIAGEKIMRSMLLIERNECETIEAGRFVMQNHN